VDRTYDEWSSDVHVLFVCTGNICRSPTAERLTWAFAAEHGLGLGQAAQALGQ